ncbi:MAG: hypothetical protein EPN48_02100 [Microbacteriaceae bacterium]|nr:MAG: hypothetical protein EPN48_02100 [Microbacteriaceae bacterium]
MRILHLSDTHLSGDGSLHYGVVDTRAALQRVLDRAAGLGAIDVVVASGDLSDDGSTASYQALRAAIEPWAARRGAAVVYAMGNHDLPAAFEAVLGDREGVRTVRGFRIVHLDSSVPGYGYGDVTAVQLDRLRKLLAEPAENGTILVVHHPPVPASTPLLVALELQHPNVLLAVCTGAAGSVGDRVVNGNHVVNNNGSDVRLILSGHYHHSVATAAAGIPVVVAPGITNTTDALAPAGTERATVGAGFALIEVPIAGAPRATFVSAPGPDDGRELFNLDAAAIQRIAREAGPQR